MKKLLFTVALILPLAGCACGPSDAEQAEMDRAYANDVAVENALRNESPQENAGSNANVAAPAPSDERPPVVVDKTMASCGTVPAKTYNEAVVESRYKVCKDASTGECYIKTIYPRPIQGCDMQFGTYQNGNPSCFNWISYIHDITTGEQVGGQVAAEYRSTDTCTETTEAYFRAKAELN